MVGFVWKTPEVPPADEILGIGCIVGAVGFGLWYEAKRLKWHAEFLKSATVRRCSELANLIDAQDGDQQPLIVAVSGRVGSKKPITCKLSGLQGVIVEEQVEVHYQRKKDDGFWIKDSVSMPLMHKEVPWYLDDGPGQCVFVREARGASGFRLTVKREAFQKSARAAELIKSLEVTELDSLLISTDTLSNVLPKIFGVKRMVWLLPTGTSLTVVGKAVKDDSGRVWIERPRGHYGPFYVAPMTMDELVEDVQNGARTISLFMKSGATMALLFITIIWVGRGFSS